MVTQESVINFFKETITKPLSFREIAFILKLSRSEIRALRRILNILVREGDIVRTRKGLYGLSEGMNLVTGYFESHKDGYGFVILEKPGERDIFIPARSKLGALSNDRVLVRIENWKKREGQIIRILERAYTRIAGKFEVTKTGFYVKPKDKSIHFDIHIPDKEKGNAKNGDMVIAEIINYPTDRKPLSGRIVKILEKPENPKADVEAIIDEFNLPRRFPKNVLEEAELLIKNNRRFKYGAELKRKDLRLLPTMTIDGERARDFDDAVSIELTMHGYKLYVHIADVSFYVVWNSALDLEARERGTSIYFPDRVLPMLPKELSEDICSLKPKVERLTFTIEMDFDRNGNRLDSKFYPSIIVSNERMTYTSVRKILIDNDPAERRKYDYLLHTFDLMAELCGLLRNNRLQRGSLDFDLPEPEVLLDIQGMPEAILRAERNFAHIMIEEFMIAANEAVSEYLKSLEIPMIYRIHEEPDPLKFKDIFKFIRSIWKSKHPLKPKDFPDILRGIKGKPEEEVIHYLILRSLKQARYSHINIGHFGLASKCYTHFTSPIRRYPDLIVHRILREVLDKKHLSKKRIQDLNKLLPDISFQSSRMERLADKAEREVIEAMRVWLMKDKVGEEFDAKVVSVTPYGLKVRLKKFFVEGFLHVSYMSDDFYQYNEQSMSLVGRHTKHSFSIGKELRVRIDRVDMDEREIILDICSS
ncbi:MAG: ribonuclease R [Nitrospirae bacterium]|nr:ribonuclease R [Nitrospirota bacterium]